MKISLFKHVSFRVVYIYIYCIISHFDELEISLRMFFLSRLRDYMYFRENNKYITLFTTLLYYFDLQ